MLFLDSSKVRQAYMLFLHDWGAAHGANPKLVHTGLDCKIHTELTSKLQRQPKNENVS